MPRGVTDQFLAILQNERRHAFRTIGAMAALSLLGYFMAELTDQPLFGPVVLLGIAALVVGVGLGVLYAWRTTTRYNASLRASWNAWMRMSLSATRVEQVARGVENKGPSWSHRIASVGWATLFLANVAVFVALWNELDNATTFGAAVTVANGLVLGALVGASAWNLRWAQQFTTALDELVAEGQVGLWGEL